MLIMLLQDLKMETARISETSAYTCYL